MWRRWGNRATSAVIGTGVGMAMRGVKNRIFRGRGRYASKRGLSKLYQKVSRIERGFLKELKTFDTNTDSTRANTGNIFNLSNMAQGDTSITREGLQCQPRSLAFKLWVVAHASATATQFRMIIFKDKEQHGVVPTVAQLLEADDHDSFPEHSSRPRFKIYRDIQILVDNTGHKQDFIKGFIKFGKKAKIWYEGTNASQVSMGKNTLYVYTISSEATNVPNYTLDTRLRFVNG